MGSQMDTTIFGSMEAIRLKTILGRSVDKRVMERLLERPDLTLAPERALVTILFADIRLAKLIFSK